jgi:hypothetical protein
MIKNIEYYTHLNCMAANYPHMLEQTALTLEQFTIIHQLNLKNYRASVFPFVRFCVFCQIQLSFLNLLHSIGTGLVQVVSKLLKHCTSIYLASMLLDRQVHTQHYSRLCHVWEGGKNMSTHDQS